MGSFFIGMKNLRYSGISEAAFNRQLYFFIIKTKYSNKFCNL